MELERKIRLFFVSYGKLLFSIIIGIAIVIYLIQSLNNYTNQNNKAKEQEKIALQQIKEKEQNTKNVITQFIEYCKNGKIEDAYNMLSDNCKKEKYVSIQNFKEQYINKYFNINICEYKIDEEKSPIEVSLTQDMLVTGRTDSVLKTSLKIFDEEKIYIYD